MENQISYRQGEVLLIKEQDEIKLGDLESLVLAEGEITGHKHEIIDGVVRKDENGWRDIKYVVSNGKTTLIHPEHNPIKIEKGIWRVRIQREYSELKNLNVAD